MSEYTKTCIYCKAEIRMSNKDEGKWLPYNFDGSAHDCKPPNKVSPEDRIHNTVSDASKGKIPLTVEERLARLEEAVFGDAE